MRIQIPGWRDDAPLIVPVELENRASFDLTSGHLRATLAREEETATVALELETLGGQRVLTVGLPAFSGALAARVLEGLGFHWSSAPGQGDGPWWNEVRHDSTGVVAWLRSAYILRLTSHPFVLDLLQRSGWPIEQGIGGSMVLAMRLAVLHDRYANAERARALTGLEHEIATADLVHYQGRPSASGVLVDPGPRDYSGDRGPAPTWEDEVGAEFAKLRELEDRRDHVVWVAGSSVASAHAVDLGDSGEVRGFLDAPDVDVVVVDSTLLTPDEEASEMRAASDRDPREDV